jgi:hypothetical protein
MFRQPTAWAFVVFFEFAGFSLWGFPGVIGGSILGFGFFRMPSVNVRSGTCGSCPRRHARNCPVPC